MRSSVSALLAVVLLAGCSHGTRPAGGKPVAHWETALHDPDVRLRKRAVLKLGNIGSVEAWPLVRRTFQDPDPRVRAEAVQAVLKFGPLGAEAVPELEALRQADPDLQVRALAGNVLVQLRGVQSAQGAR